MRRNVKRAAALTLIFIALWYVGAMLDFFPFIGDLEIRATGFTGLLLCIVHMCWTDEEIRRSGTRSRITGGRMSMKKMEQSEAEEIAGRWKYDGEYAFYDMTADSDDYREIVTPELRGDKYYSVFDGSDLIGFFCVEQENAEIEIGLGLRPDLTGRGMGKTFLSEILRFIRENYQFEKIQISVASFNHRAIKVYERAGFVKTGTAQVPTNGGLYDFTLMELKQ